MSFDPLESTHTEAPPSAQPLEAKKAPEVERSCRLADDVLLLLVQFPESQPVKREPPVVRAVCSESSLALESEGIYFSSSDRRGALLLRVVMPDTLPDPLHAVEIEHGSAAFFLDPSSLRGSEADAQTFLLYGLAGANEDDRGRLMEFLASTAATKVGAAEAYDLSPTLYRFREGLRDRYPRSGIAPDLHRGLHVDALLRIDERSFYIRGWMVDQQSEIESLSAISPEGARAELLERFFPYVRPDVDRFRGASSPEHRRAVGFISFFELAAPSFLEKEWLLQMQNRNEEGMETSVCVTATDLVKARTMILEDLAHSRANGELMLKQIYPAIQRLQLREQEYFAIEEVHQFGLPAKAPEISIIVPLYRRIDFVEQQLAQFFRDPEILASDLIYVLDSPELAEELREASLHLAGIYKVPFRVVTLKQNSGFSAANNFGASLAKGRKLLFLNSDVLPDRPGWISQLASFYDSVPKMGALGAKLLYEDNSVQHAGMYFRRDAASGLWENMHYFKGLHRNLPAVDITRQVPAVSAACLMISRELFEEVGGFRSLYVQGDFEDSDLCLRLGREGRQNWYLHEVELYHLEGQSYPNALRRTVSRYNRHLHTHFWNDEIERVMRGQFHSGPLSGSSELATG